MDADVKDAVLELAGFYGMSLGDKYVKAIVDGKNTTQAIKAAADSAVANPASVFNEDKKHFKTIKQAAEAIKDMTGVENKICITPDHDSSMPSGNIDKIKNRYSVGDQGKGEPANGHFYTVDEMRPAGGRVGIQGGEPDVHVIQVFNADNAPSNSNTELVALWLNSIPGTEMSRAVPFLDIRVSLPGGGDDDKLISGAKPMSLFSFLNGKKDPSAAAKDIMKANFLEDIEAGQQAMDSIAAQPKNSKIVSSMEVFTSPQTLLSGRASQNSDPFRPFMSFNSLSINHAPAGGMMSFQTAEMDIVLHDRTRLNDVLGLVAPGTIGKTQIEVHYGWSHPDNNKFGRVADASVNNRYAKLINAMRSIEVYNVTSTDYKFNDAGEIEITVKLALAGGSVAGTAEITDSMAEMKEEALGKLFERVRGLIASVRSSNAGTIGRIALPAYVTSSASIGGASQIKRADLRKLRSFIQRAKGSSNSELKQMGEELGKAYGTGDDSYDAFKKSKKAILDDLIKLMKTNVDPFLPTRRIGNVTQNAMLVAGRYRAKKAQRYISFGKAFSIFVGEAFKAKYDQFSEIQIIFYPINESASHAHTLNLAQFPINLDDFGKIMLDKMDPVQKMTIGRFLNILNSYYFRDQGSAVYGMNTLYGSRVQKDGDYTTERKRKRGFREADELAEGKLDVLRKAYGLGEGESDFTFRMPQVTVKYEAAPVTPVEGSRVAPILRVHVMDQSCGSAEQLKDVLMAFGGDGRFIQKARNVDVKGARHPEHGKHISRIITKLKDEGLIELDTQAGSVQLGADTTYKIKTTPVGNTDNLSLAFDLKDKIKGMFPTVTYGAANSNMTQADLSTMSDSGMNTIMLMRQDSSDDDNDVGTEGGLPLQIMPTQLSIDTMGCPYVSFGQQLFVDFGTNTTADNFYAVTGIQHSFSSGEFNTSIDMVQLDGFGTFRSALSSLKKLQLALNDS